MPALPEGRFYEAELPEQDELVVVKVKGIVETGVYVQLLEYNRKLAYCPLGELTVRSTFSAPKLAQRLARIGRIQVSRVVRVDPDPQKGYLDCSKKKVHPEDAAKKEEAFKKAKDVHSVLRHVAGLHKLELEDLCCKVSWPLHKKHGSAHEALSRHVSGQINVWDELDFSKPGKDLSSLALKLKADIEHHMRRRIEPQVMRLRAKVELTCEAEDGIDAIREALLAGLKASKDDCEVKVKLVAHPSFYVTCSHRDKEYGIGVLKEAADLMEESIAPKGGHCFLRAGPDLVGEEVEHDYPDHSSEGAFSDGDCDSESCDDADPSSKTNEDDLDDGSKEGRRKVNFASKDDSIEPLAD